MKYDVASAQKYATDGQIEAWVHAYLAEDDWANSGLSEGLKLQTRYWTGPIEVPLDDLVRTCGPEPGMPFQVDAAGWELKVTLLTRSIQDPTDLSPVIAEYLQRILYVRDGNHRHEALRRYGANHCWTLIWYNSEEDWKEHNVEEV
jgi:hypothetical protein